MKLLFDQNLSPKVRARLRVVQDGFACDGAADEFYAGCEVGWRDTSREFESIWPER